MRLLFNQTDSDSYLKLFSGNLANNELQRLRNENTRLRQELSAHGENKFRQLMKFIPGPDFPTGGNIIGKDMIKQGYNKGRGSFKIRGEIGEETLKNGKLCAQSRMRRWSNNFRLRYGARIISK